MATDTAWDDNDEDEHVMVEGDAGGDKIVIPQITTNKIGDDEHDG